MIQSVNKYHIYEILSSDGNFYYTIPKYQREYTWSYREWEALYDDISENNDKLTRYRAIFEKAEDGNFIYKAIEKVK